MTEQNKISIEASENGPYIIRVDGDVVSALCRCGYSKDKPYCDGSHRQVGFKAVRKEIKIEK